MKRRYAVVWEKETLFGKMVDISRYTADSKEEAEAIGLLKIKNDRYGKCTKVITIDYEKEAKKAWEYAFAKGFIETWGGSCDWFDTNAKN